MNRVAELPVLRHVAEAVGEVVDRARTGQLRSLGGVAALVVVWIGFGVLAPAFLSADNLVNVTQQSAVVGLLALGVVLVMLIGQLDLSVGAVSALGSAIVAVGSQQAGLPMWLSVIAAVGAGAVVGLGYGIVSQRFGVPGLVLTLAGLLAAHGLQLTVLGATGSVNVPYESWLVRFAQATYLEPSAALGGGIVVVAAVAVLSVRDRRHRMSAGLPARSWEEITVRLVGLAVVLLGGAAYLSTDRGVGAMFVVFLAAVALVDVAVRRTRWGRAVRAVGGDAESARRAGLSVKGVTISVYVLCSTLAALGGVLAVGRLAAANQGSGGAELSLTAIAAALIGGASLYGGRGSAWSAFLGVLVVQSISTGLAMTSAPPAVRYLVLAVTLVLAVAIDTSSHRRRAGVLSGR
ncbi:sugar ABC transporter permease [Sanguibacter sp. A247]|uniref:sugar ABC transporter permease n=1 Tax=unclassified Sanguibacter TaxID=2645534 RepID=UPI003FD73644